MWVRASGILDKAINGKASKRDLDSVAGDESRSPKVLTNGAESLFGGVFYSSIPNSGAEENIALFHYGCGIKPCRIPKRAEASVDRIASYARPVPNDQTVEGSCSGGEKSAFTHGSRTMTRG